MIETSGDMFKMFDDDGYDAIVIPTNGTLNKSGELVMGAGVAKAAADRWMWLPSALALGREQFIVPLRHPDGKRHIIAFRTKSHWRDASRPSLVRQSAQSLVNWADRELSSSCKVILPRVGCGLGGLTWYDIKKILSPIMDDRFHVTKGK